MLWMFADTLAASRCSGCSQILWMLADIRGCSGCSALLRMFGDALDVRRCSGCSAMLWMFGDALDVRRCSGCSPMLWTRQAALLWSKRFCANLECLRPETRSLPQSSRSLHRVQAEKQETNETDRARGTAPFRRNLARPSWQTPTPPGRTMAQKILHGFCVHFRAF